MKKKRQGPERRTPKGKMEPLFKDLGLKPKRFPRPWTNNVHILKANGRAHQLKRELPKLVDIGKVERGPAKTIIKEAQHIIANYRNRKLREQQAITFLNLTSYVMQYLPLKRRK